MEKQRKNDTLVNTTYLDIRKDITEGFLIAGTKINIRQLSERYSVSETPIKQALNRLMMEGLVESIPRKGMKVKRYSWVEIEEILDVRLMMETFFIKPVITTLNSSTKMREQFEQNIKDQFMYVENLNGVSNYYTLYNLDQQFHELYLKCSGNKKVVELFKSLNSHSYATYLYGKQPISKTLAGLEEHKAIYEALIAQDEEKALELIKLHNKNARDIIYLMMKVGGAANG